MADLNFGLLQGVPLPTPGQQVAQVPTGGGLGSLLNGLAQGRQQAIENAANQSKLAMMQQQNDMQMQMMPAQIAEANARASLLQQQAQQAQSDEAVRQQAANVPIPTQLGPGTGGIDEYTRQLAGIYSKAGRPELAMKVLEGAQSLSNSTLKNQQALMEMTASEAKNKFEQLKNAGGLAFSLTQLPDDQAARLYNSQYGKIINSIDSNSPKIGSSADEIVAYLHGASSSLLKWDETLKNNPALVAKLMPTPESEAALSKNLLATGGPETALDKAIAKSDAGIYRTAVDSIEAMKSFRNTVQTAQAELKSVPDAVLGPAANFFRNPKFQKQAQVLKSSLNAAALQAKEMYRLGSGQGFTDADRDFLTEVVGNTAIDKMPLQTILEKMEKVSQKAELAAWKQANSIRKQSRGYDAWLTENPKPEFNTQNTASANGFQDGQIYQDANGNQARYINGQWAPVK